MFFTELWRQEQLSAVYLVFRQYGQTETSDRGGKVKEKVFQYLLTTDGVTLDTSVPQILKCEFLSNLYTEGVYL